MLRIPTGPGGRAPARLRLLTLAGLAAVAVLLPLGAASAGPAGAGGADPSGGGAPGGGPFGGRTSAAAPAFGKPASGKSAPGGPVAGTAAAGAPVAPTAALPTPAAVPPAREGAVAGREERERPRSLGLGEATAVRCGPELSAPDGVEAQTCVLTRGGESWARVYYRNTSGDALEALLSLMGPGGRTVLTRCAAGGDDEPATCETPHLRTQGVPGAYSAVAEFAGRGDAAPLMLRAGSNFPRLQGSW
ncbi:hypothetical protein [Streptomyces sp. LaPpAH-108]|uniref:hypothetical protein n=1 Tax=Streptomyces sp. LaPpAH-108 TaxID=1155714 RepID=UPI000375433B|nr:hypothetical protein [Streptomyces sp. LaPpAH-108]